MIDPETGKIAFHAIRFVENGSDFVQYDFDGNIEYITPYTRYPKIDINPNNP